LLEEDEDPDVKHAFSIACERGHVDAARLLLERKGANFNVNETYDGGRS